MSWRLLDISKVPAKGWKAAQPENGHVVRGGSLDRLVIAVSKYRTANRLPVEKNIRRQVETQVCETMGDHERSIRCRKLSENDSLNPEHLRNFRSSWTDVKNFGIAVKEVAGRALFKQGGLHISQKEAERRGKICAECPFNLPVTNCWGCGLLGSLYRELAGHKRTSSDSKLKTCDVCGCDNRTQIHYTTDVLGAVAAKQGLSPEAFPDHCWKKEILETSGYPAP